jgi:hypothetical protein
MSDSKSNTSSRTWWDGTPGVASPLQLVSGTASQLFTVGNETSSLYPLRKVTISILDVKPQQPRSKPSVSIIPTPKKPRATSLRDRPRLPPQ